MNYPKSDFGANVDNGRIEFEENKVILWLKKFWHFSLFYGDYLGSLHSKKESN